VASSWRQRASLAVRWQGRKPSSHTEAKTVVVRGGRPGMAKAAFVARQDHRRFRNADSHSEMLQNAAKC
jgi:hypothetical protein